MSEDVLTPRPDTEILVEAAIKYAKEKGAKKKETIYYWDYYFRMFHFLFDEL